MRPILVLTVLAASLAGESRYTVTAETLSDRAISPLLSSHFVEIGYGYQIEPMMAEMLFNRSFEPYMPYRENSFTWFGLWRDESDHSKGYETDWRKMSWYHSGYEHNSWFAAPGDEGPFHIDQRSTFLVLQSPVRKVRLEPVRPARHGLQALRLVNDDSREWGGLAQQRKYLRKGETYRFQGLLRSEGKPVRAELRIYKQGQWDRPIATMPVGEITSSDYQRKKAEFRNANFEGFATFSLWIPPGSSVIADDFSLTPASAFHGWREDVVRTIEQLHPKLFRFPGGCFASFYDWRNGIGPLENRKPEPSYFWGGMNYNDLGTDEFAAMCKRVGAEMMFAVNMHHPAKKDYLLKTPNKPPAQNDYSWDMSRFTDLEKGAREAAAWVAYCKKWGVKYWELDNETYRWFTPEEYGKAAVQYARAMKHSDPTIKIGMVTYGRFRPHIAALLETAGRDIDFLADRTDSEEGLDDVLAVMRAYNKKSGRQIFYANTEWLPRETVEKQRADNAVIGISRRDFWDRMSRWRMGMVVLANMMSWQRHGGDVGWVNFNNLSNTHSQSAIETPKETSYLTACGVAMAAIAKSPAAWPLRVDGYQPKVADTFQVQAAWDAGRAKLVLYVLNRTPESRDITFDLNRLKRNFTKAGITRTSAEDQNAKITIQRTESLKASPELSLRANPWSFTELILN